MSNFASIEVVFDEITSSQGAELQIKFNNPGITELIWSAEASRTVAFTYEISTTTKEDQANKAFNAVAADIANHGTLSSKMIVTQPATDRFVITANEFGWAIIDGGTTPDVEATLTATPEVLPAKDFQLIGDILTPTLVNPPCSHIRVGVESNADGVAPFTWITPALSSSTFFPFVYAEVARQAALTTLDITVADNEADQATRLNVSIPPIFDSAFITDISVVANAGGFDSTVTAFVTNPSDIFTFTYSIDGATFQISNIFPNVLDGSYTLYVNDGFGCVATQAFTVNASTSIQRDPANASVPTANSIRMIQNTSNQFQNLDNTLYDDEEFVNEDKKFYKQPYQTDDGFITTQFTTNYDTLSAKTIDCSDATILTPTITKKSDNIDARDSRDCIAFNRGNNQTGIYFTSGNIYDPGTTDIIDTYILDGQLPDWGVVGNTMILSGAISGSFIIKQVVFDSTVRANALIFDNTWTSGNQSEALIADVTYNRLPFEVYEFDNDLALLGEGIFQNQLILSDSLLEFPTLVFNSERFIIKTTQRKTIFIEYSDSPGTGIDYSTGYLGRVRIHGQPQGYSPSFGGSVDVYTDSGENLKKVDDNPTRGGLAFFHQFPRYMGEKLRLIFAHENYSINGEDLQNEEEFEFIDVPMSSLKNGQIQVRKINYEAYKNDNIQIDGPTGALLQENGKILQ